MTGLQDAKEMPFLDHLEELRRRLFWCFGAVVIGVVAAFIIMTQLDVIRLIMGPIQPHLQGDRLVFTHPGDPFRIVMSASFALGFIFALPVIAYHVWGFLSPALYRHEKRVIIPVLVGATVLFLAGVCLAFFVILPVTLRFLLGFQTASLAPMITAGEYFSFALSLSLAFGAVFELPILIVALTALGLVTPRFLAKFRRHAVVLCIVTAALITPGGDPMSLFIMSVPLYLLYEVSIGLSVLVYRRRARNAPRGEREAEAAA